MSGGRQCRVHRREAADVLQLRVGPCANSSRGERSSAWPRHGRSNFGTSVEWGGGGGIANARTGLDELPGDHGVARAHRVVQRRPHGLVDHGVLGAVGQQEHGHVDLAGRRGNVQRPAAVGAALAVGVGAGGEQQLGRLQLLALDRGMQRGPAVVAAVNVVAFVQLLPKQLQPASRGGFAEDPLGRDLGTAAAGRWGQCAAGMHCEAHHMRARFGGAGRGGLLYLEDATLLGLGIFFEAEPHRFGLGVRGDICHAPGELPASCQQLSVVRCLLDPNAEFAHARDPLGCVHSTVCVSSREVEFVGSSYLYYIYNS